VWKEYGALEYRECVGDDLKVKGTRTLDMPFESKRMVYGGFEVLVDL
jgi:uncharacterized protein YbaA (DUF1428 family)